MLLLLGFAFLSGLVTILAPCIWPILPVVLSSSLTKTKKGGHQRALGITLGVMLSFTIFTLSVSSLISIFHINPNSLRILAVMVIALLGFIMIIPYLSVRFEVFVSKLANIFGQNTKNQANEFLPGFIIGLSLGIVWSPCAGPILAAIATLAATGKVSLEVILITLSYVIGAGIPLFAFAYGGQQFITRARWLNTYTGKIQQLFGIVMIVMAILIYTNQDQAIQLALLNKFPVLGTALNGFEQNTQVTNALKTITGNNTIVTNNMLFNTNQPAPELTGITHWLNSEKPVTISSLKGKVVLVDFWTYSCINCIRTLPHVTTWYDTYKDKGFVVIGVHTPEFQFEHDTNNVLNAIKMYNIHYPVAQDNDYATWNAYSNQYWPAEYLIDANGIIRRVEFGEGEYDQTEEAIQALLKEAGQKITSGLHTMQDQTPTSNLSPETYLGSSRMQYLVNTGTAQNGKQQFLLTGSLPQDQFAFGGTWDITNEYAIAGKNAVLEYNFTAGKVFLVMAPVNTHSGTIKVLLDGKPITPSATGKDVIEGSITVDTDRLYELVNLHGKVENHLLSLQFQTDGIQAYAFTFGQ